MLRKTLVVAAALIFASVTPGQAQEKMKGEMTKFTVRIENISSPDGIDAPEKQ